MNFKTKGEWLEIIIPLGWTGYSVDFILRDLWNGPKKQIHQLRMEKAILINSELANWSQPLRTGDRLQIKFFSEQDFGMIPAYIDVEILYEDDHILVVNKPACIDTHPNEPNQANTLANAVAFYLQSNGEQRKVIHIHRLDHGTSGAVLFAKHSFVGAILDKMLEERKISRTYVAITDGIINRKQGTINAPIGRDRHHPTKRRVSPTGQAAVTHFKVLEKYPDSNRTLIQCQLDTGRTHQIRVHLSSIGHPIAGDILYGGSPVFPRTALHAAKLSFVHPITEEDIVCHAPFHDQPAIFPDHTLDLIKSI